MDFNTFISKRPVLLAPMAGITDTAFREMCLKYGAELAYTEMISAKGMHYNCMATRKLIELSEREGPCGVQLFGSSPDILADISREIESEYGEKVALIDINMGCPARKIVSNGEGSALMLDLPLASQIISAVKKAVRLPVSVKFRKGFDSEHLNAVEFAKMAQDSGADIITIHGRTREQMYSGKVDLDAIAAVKRSVTIPVIGNGDIFSGTDAANMLKYTGCDGIMVARGAQGNPFIFEEIKAYLSGSPYTPPSAEQRAAAALEHAKRHLELKGERSIIELRKHMAWYVSSARGVGKIRTRLMRAQTLDDIKYALAEYAENCRIS